MTTKKKTPAKKNTLGVQQEEKKTKKTDQKVPDRRPGEVSPLLAHPGKVTMPDDRSPDDSRIQQWPVRAAPGVGTVFGWDVTSVRSALAAHASGSFSASGALLDDMVTNPILGHCNEVRKESFRTLPQNFTPGSGPNAVRCRDFLRELWPDICPLQTMDEWWTHRTYMGESVSAMDWEIRTDGRDRWWIPKIRPWHPSQTYRAFLPDMSNSPGASGDGRVMVAITREKGPVVVEPGLGRWLMFSNGTLSPWMNGLIRNLAESYLGDTYTLHDNLALQERFGQGFFKLHHPMSWNDKQVANSMSSIRGAGRGGVVSCPEDASGKKRVDVDLVRADAAGYQLFDMTEKRLLRRFLIALLGQDGTSMQGSGPYTQMVVHSSILWNKREMDAANFGDARLSVQVDDYGLSQKRWIPHNGVIRSQLTKWISYFNFGNFEDAPYVWWDATPPEDRLMREITDLQVWRLFDAHAG